ncbi:hypothetical protein HanIR_Chr05g0219301 [Helianthus annuus]|nr:hypothetical protein HanIR_Chr05g0219301 [Helianthus annuus]
MLLWFPRGEVFVCYNINKRCGHFKKWCGFPQPHLLQLDLMVLLLLVRLQHRMIKSISPQLLSFCVLVSTSPFSL